LRGYQPTASPEGSCLHVKRGALLDFKVYSNFGAPDIYMLPRRATWTSGPAKCAELCLGAELCNAFTYTIRENGNPPSVISCRLLQIPTEMNPPMGLMAKDGVLDVVDFYDREIVVNATTVINTKGTRVNTRGDNAHTEEQQH